MSTLILQDIVRMYSKPKERSIELHLIEYNMNNWDCYLIKLLKKYKQTQ